MHNEVVDLASTLPTVVNAVSHPKPKSDASAVWPIQVVLRDSEGAQRVKDAWLSEQFHACLGREFDLGVKASRHQPGMSARLVLKGLGEGRMFLAKERVRDPAERVMEVRHRDAAQNASRRVGFRMVVVAEEIEYRTDSTLCTSDKMARACYGVGTTLGRIWCPRVPSLRAGSGAAPLPTVLSGCRPCRVFVLVPAPCCVFLCGRVFFFPLLSSVSLLWLCGFSLLLCRVVFCWSCPLLVSPSALLAVCFVREACYACFRVLRLQGPFAAGGSLRGELLVATLFDLFVWLFWGFICGRC